MTRQTRLLRSFLLIVVLAVALIGFLQRQQIYDFFVLQTYNPPQRIVDLVDQTTMTDKMRRVFYVNRPAIRDKASFRGTCDSSERSIVLGCYISSKGIFLLDVNDKRLDGVIPVTAAHEALHAQYDRLSSSEKKRIDGLTSQYYESIRSERIKKTVELYRSKDPSIVPNELHSILATEVRQLPKELEDYYARYFKNRSQIVAFSEKYEQTFAELESQVKEYDAQLNSMKTQIDSSQAEIQGLSSEIELQKSYLDQLTARGDVEQYNAAVPDFNASVNRYNTLVNSTRNIINRYNQIVEKRNAIATAEQELIEAIQSNVGTREKR